MDDKPVIRGLHHNAYRCRDAEATRQFYEDFLGLDLADAFEIGVTKSGRDTPRAPHVFRDGRWVVPRLL